MFIAFGCFFFIWFFFIEMPMLLHKGISCVLITVYRAEPSFKWATLILKQKQYQALVTGIFRLILCLGKRKGASGNDHKQNTSAWKSNKLHGCGCWDFLFFLLVLPGSMVMEMLQRLQCLYVVFPCQYFKCWYYWFCLPLILYLRVSLKTTHFELSG